jgi:hypothetical protein
MAAFILIIIVIYFRSFASAMSFNPRFLSPHADQQKPIPPLKPNLDPPSSSPSSTAVKLVPLEAHIMSKCPDARDCLSQLLVPVLSNVSSHINFTLSYIGQPTEADDGVACKHGPTECLGNILQLCAEVAYPDPLQWVGFAMCMEKQFDHIPERWLVQNCAAEYGIELERLNECASREDGGFAIGLLRDSVERSKEAGVTLSCTVSFWTILITYFAGSNLFTGPIE